MRFWGKKEETVSKAEHTEAVERLNDEIATLNDELRTERGTVGRLVAANRALKAEAAADAADAAKFRKLTANLKQNRAKQPA